MAIIYYKRIKDIGRHPDIGQIEAVVASHDAEHGTPSVHLGIDAGNAQFSAQIDPKAVRKLAAELNAAADAIEQLQVAA